MTRGLWVVCVLVAAVSPAGAEGGATDGEAEASADDGSVMIVFENEDQVHARILGIEEGELVFALVVAPEQPLRADMDRVNRIAADRKVGVPPEKARLMLHTGTTLFGALVGFEDGGLVFADDDVGELTIPMETVAAYESGASVPLTEEIDFTKHVIQSASGDVLVGKPRTAGPKTIQVKGEEVELAIESDEISAMYFPAPDDKDELEDATFRLVQLTSGAVLTGRRLAMEDEKLSVELHKAGSVSVPMAKVAEISVVRGPVVAGRSHLRRVLVWGGMADQDEELARTIAALQEKLPGWEIERNVSREFDNEFARKLMRCRALVIAEQESWGGGHDELARQLGPLAKRFLQSGGNIVLLGMVERETGFCREAGLIDYQKVNAGDNMAISFTEAGEALGRGVGGTFTSTNSTMRYRSGDAIPSKVLATDDRGAAIIGRRASRGWVILMGMDYYAHNDGTKQVLANAVRLR